jgi:hypothetical protein
MEERGFLIYNLVIRLAKIYRIYSRNLRNFFLVWPLKNRGA